MTYSIAETARTIVEPGTGRDDNIRSAVGSITEAPKFVDNAVHHAVYDRESHTSGRYLSLSRFTTSDFQTTRGGRYRLIEEESAGRVTYPDRAGIKDDTSVFFRDGVLSADSTPPMLLFADDDPSVRIRPDRVEAANFGNRFIFQNMQGKTLVEKGFEAEHVYTGQLTSVGLRTTDLVPRILKDHLHNFNSVSVGLPFSGPRAGTISSHKGADVSRHSMNFLAQDFKSVAVPSAIRFVARHDHYAIFFDKFGNFIYAPDIFYATDRKTGPNRGEGSVEVDPVVDVANRIVVRGSSVAINDIIEAIVDDAELQKKHGAVKSTTVSDPTAGTKAGARKTAAQLLRLNRKAQEAIKSEDHAQVWDIGPGDVVDYENPTTGNQTRRAVVEVNHRLRDGRSNLMLLSYEKGIEGVLMAFEDASAFNSEMDASDNTQQRITLEKSGVGRANIRVFGEVIRRNVLSNLSRNNSAVTGITMTNSGNDIHAGLLLGHRGYNAGDSSARSSVGTGLTPRLTGGSFSSTTITVSSTTGFPSTGHLLINESIHASYTGTTSTTFTGVTVRAPNGATIGSSGLSIRLLRPRSHEMRKVKGGLRRRRI
tara:strand:- start:1452 stop:3233 length:1782 start_codon:yes stop_codon:yes gene_type:complete